MNAVQQGIDTLTNNPLGSFPRDALQALIDHQDEAAPLLQDYLATVAANVEQAIENDQTDLMLFALFLLAQFRETRAYRPLIELLGQLDETNDDFLGDLLNDILVKQEWFREYQLANGQPRRAFVGSRSLNDQPVDVAEDIASVLGITGRLRQQASSWEHYLGLLIEKAESVGILEMKSSIVGSNTKRPLAVEAFRGFAISDDYAPLMFINTADAPPARLFTLAHELAHLG